MKRTLTLVGLGALVLFRLAFFAKEKAVTLDFCRRAYQGEVELLGVVSKSSNNGFEGTGLSNPQGKRLRATVYLPGSGREILTFGDRFWVRGNFVCKEGPRNLSHRQDLWFFGDSIRLVPNDRLWRFVRLKPKGLREVKPSLIRHFQGSLHRYPSTRSLVIAVWTGVVDLGEPTLWTSFCQLGLLPLLALSGQHVSILVMLLWGLIRGAVWAMLGLGVSLRFLSVIERVWPWIPVFGASLLLVTSGYSPSMIRTEGMAVGLLVIPLLRWNLGTLQALGSSAAVLVLLSPDLLQSIGFVLSVVCCFFLLGQGSLKGMCRNYVWMSLLLPLYAFPLSGFFFLKVPWVAPVSILLLSWLWVIFLIPVGFVVGALAGWNAVLSDWLMGPLEAIIRWVFHLHSVLGTQLEGSYRVFVHLSLVELIVLEVGLVGLGSIAIKYVRSFQSRAAQVIDFPVQKR